MPCSYQEPREALLVTSHIRPDIAELLWPAQIKAAKPQVFPDQQQGFGGGRGGGFGGGRGFGGQRGLRSCPTLPPAHVNWQQCST